MDARLAFEAAHEHVDFEMRSDGGSGGGISSRLEVSATPCEILRTVVQPDELDELVDEICDSDGGAADEDDAYDLGAQPQS